MLILRSPAATTRRIPIHATVRRVRERAMTVFRRRDERDAIDMTCVSRTLAASRRRTGAAKPSPSRSN